MVHSKAKGKRTELELVALLREALGDASIARNLEQARAGGADLKGRSLRYFAVESKAEERPRWANWFRQAEAQVVGDQVPVVAQWRPNQPWRFFLVVDLRTFARFVKWTNCLKDGEV